MRVGKRQGLMCLMFLMMGSCTRPFQAVVQAPEADRSAILGGTEVLADSEIALRTVLIVRLLPSLVEDVKYNIERCTGTLVAPRVVLTAAHCTKDFDPSNTFVFFETNPPMDIESVDISTAALVSRALVHPFGHDGDDAKRIDLAFLRLAEDAPAEKVFARIPEDAVDPETEGEVTLAGYGLTIGGIGADDAPVLLRETKVKILKAESLPRIRSIFTETMRNPSPTEIGRIEEMLNSLLILKQGAPHLWTDQSQSSGACWGDSGGPMFVQRGGMLLQVGVAGFVIQPTPSLTCRVTLAYTSLASQREWLDQAFNEINESKDLSLFLKEGLKR